jgi:hypothetical protein
MQWLAIQAVLVLVTLVAASSQCLARCAGLPCHDLQSPSEERGQSKVPPCHRHRQPPKGPAHACQVSLTFVEQRLPVFARINTFVLVGAFAEPNSPFRMPIPLYAWRARAPEISPPPSPEPFFSTVLRI